MKYNDNYLERSENSFLNFIEKFRSEVIYYFTDPTSQHFLGLDEENLDIFMSRQDVSDLLKHMENNPNIINPAFFKHFSAKEIEFFKACLNQEREKLTTILKDLSDEDCVNYQKLWSYGLYFAACFNDFNAINFFINEVSLATSEIYPDYTYNLTISLISLSDSIPYDIESRRNCASYKKKIIMLLIEKGADLSQPLPESPCAYYEMVSALSNDGKNYLSLFDEEFLISMLKHVKDVNIQNYHLYCEIKPDGSETLSILEETDSFLWNAIKLGYPNLVKALIYMGADINHVASSKHSYSALKESANKGYKYLEILVNSGQKIENFDSIYDYVLSLQSLRQGDDNIYYPDYYIYSEDELISLLKHVQNVNSVNYVAIKYANDPEPTNELQQSFLMKAIESRRLKLTEALVTKGADINYLYKQLSCYYGSENCYYKSIVVEAINAGPEYLKVILKSCQKLDLKLCSATHYPEQGLSNFLHINGCIISTDIHGNQVIDINGNSLDKLVGIMQEQIQFESAAHKYIISLQNILRESYPYHSNTNEKEMFLNFQTLINHLKSTPGFEIKYNSSYETLSMPDNFKENFQSCMQHIMKDLSQILHYALESNMMKIFGICKNSTPILYVENSEKILVEQQIPSELWSKIGMYLTQTIATDAAQNITLSMLEQAQTLLGISIDFIRFTDANGMIDLAAANAHLLELTGQPDYDYDQ